MGRLIEEEEIIRVLNKEYNLAGLETIVMPKMEVGYDVDYVINKMRDIEEIADRDTYLKAIDIVRSGYTTNSKYAFKTNDDKFGAYARIPYGHDYNNTKIKHIYKVVGSFKSNRWCEIPITYQSENNPVVHDHLEAVLNVIHCGIDETKVIRVALKDCEIIGEDICE